MNYAPWSQVLAEAQSLNDPANPFSFAVEGEALVGYWDIAKIRMLGLAGASMYDDDYRIDFRPVGDGVFDWTEQRNTTEGKAGLGGVSGSKSTFKGKSKSFSFGASVGEGTNKGEPTNAATYSFNTEAIKAPAVAYLERLGWTKKKGLLGRLFG